MAPIKLEDNIKDEFKNRTINPSDQSWNKLATRLDEQQSKNKGSRIWWAIAAGIVGLSIIGSLFLFGGKQNAQDSLVTSPNFDEQVQTQDDLSPIVDAIESLPVKEEQNLEQGETESTSTAQVASSKSNKTNTKTTKTYPLKQKQTLVAALEGQKSATDTTQKKVVTVANMLPVNTTSIDPITAKVDQVVASIAAMEKNNQTITEAEIEALLLAAQKELKVTPLINPNTQKVDANALLMNVEFELERSFRDKVFDALGDGYKKIRTAMADRNN